jgi:hypothetical protein
MKMDMPMRPPRSMSEAAEQKCRRLKQGQFTIARLMWLVFIVALICATRPLLLLAVPLLIIVTAPAAGYVYAVRRSLASRNVEHVTKPMLYLVDALLVLGLLTSVLFGIVILSWILGGWVRLSNK